MKNFRILHGHVCIMNLKGGSYQSPNADVSVRNSFFDCDITKKSPCKSASKTGVYRGIHFFLFLLQNIDRGYSLEPPH